MKIPAEDYGPLKSFFGWMLANEMSQLLSLAPESHPLAVLDGWEKTSLAKARAGLGIAIGDVVDMFADADEKDILRIDEGLRQNGLPTLTHVRARFWRKVQSILKRSRVRNEGEYYVLRNVVDAMPGDEAGKVWALLDDFEISIAKAGAR